MDELNILEILEKREEMIKKVCILVLVLEKCVVRVLEVIYFGICINRNRKKK